MVSRIQTEPLHWDVLLRRSGVAGEYGSPGAPKAFSAALLTCFPSVRLSSSVIGSTNCHLGRNSVLGLVLNFPIRVLG